MVKVFKKLAERRKQHNRSTTAMPAVLRVLFSAVFLILLAMIYTWFIFWRQNLGDSEAVDEFISEKPGLFTYSYIIIALVMLLMAAITWKPFLTAGIVFAVLSGITYAHIQKFTVRQIPLLPEDFQMAGQLGGMMEFVNIEEIIRLVFGIVFIIVGSALADHFAKKIFGHRTVNLAWWERWAIVPRVTLSMIVLTVLVLVAAPVVRDKKQGKNAIEWINGINLVGWDQVTNYHENGFVIGFLYNLGALEAEEPEGYNEERVAQILGKYENIRKADEAERESLADVVDNLILVMNESFYDPELLNKTVYAHSGGDVVPNLHKIFQKYPSGYMYSPEYGGNTANVEFAAFTSLSNYWAGSIPYVNSLSKISHIPGIVSFAKEGGLTPTAIHSYDGSMYKRNFVYANMGFDSFIDIHKMKHTDKENGNGYIKDSEIYKEILDILNDGEEKHMVGAITMQNHGPYDAAGYSDLHFTLSSYIVTRYAAENSFESLHYSDKYLGEFINELDKLEGKTVMIWFGDHAAGVLDELTLSGDKSLVDLAHLTPYFIYANFDLENVFTEKEVVKLNSENGFNFKTKGVDLPTVTPNCLANILYDVLGVEKPALVYLAAEVCEDTPILAPTYLADSELEMTEALTDYQIINYDILNGKKYSLK